MTLVQLRQFIALAKVSSFVKAADALHMTQPALSGSIKALEDELGKQLFDRIGKRIELNSFGLDVLTRSHTLVEYAQQLKDCGRILSAGDSGRIRLGLSSGPGAMLSTPILTHFGTNFPNFHIEIVRSNTTSLAQMLRDRLIDAAVLDIRSLRPAPDLRVSQIVWIVTNVPPNKLVATVFASSADLTTCTPRCSVPTIFPFPRPPA